jgi:hypothetical protein
MPCHPTGAVDKDCSEQDARERAPFQRYNRLADHPPTVLHGSSPTDRPSNCSYRLILEPSGVPGFWRRLLSGKSLAWGQGRHPCMTAPLKN